MNSENATFDTSRVAELIAEYEDTESRQQRRHLENQILQETVWRNRESDREVFAVFSRKQFEIIRDGVEVKDEMARMILKGPYLLDGL